MKKYILAFALLATFLSGTPVVHAQDACSSSIDAQNYKECCDPALDSSAVNDEWCTAYEKKLQEAAAGSAIASPAAGDGEACFLITEQNVQTCCRTTRERSNDEQQACINYLSNGVLMGGGNNIPVGVANEGNVSLSTTTSTVRSNQLTSSACSTIKFKTLLDIAIWAKCIIGDIVIPGIFTLAFAVFLWGVFKFVRSSEEKDKKDSKQFIYMGLIGLFVMVSVWGIIRLVNGVFGLDTAVPTLSTSALNIKNASK